MDRPTEPGWYLCDTIFRNKPVTRAYYWNGVELRGYEGGHFCCELANHSNFRPLIPKPVPEIIHGDGIKVLRPGVWWMAGKNNRGVLWTDGRGLDVGSRDVTYTRIGDVPGERE